MLYTIASEITKARESMSERMNILASVHRICVNNI